MNIIESLKIKSPISSEMYDVVRFKHFIGCPRDTAHRAILGNSTGRSNRPELNPKIVNLEREAKYRRIFDKNL